MSNYQISFWIRFPSRRCDPNNVCLAYKPTERRLLNPTKKVPTHQKILMELMVYLWTSRAIFCQIILTCKIHSTGVRTYSNCSLMFAVWTVSTDRWTRAVRTVQSKKLSLKQSESDCSALTAQVVEQQTSTIRCHPCRHVDALSI